MRAIRGVGHLERELVLLAAPNFEALVVAAELEEELFADGEQTTGHDGALERPRRVLRVVGQQRQALVKKLPVKSAARAFVLGPVKSVQCE